MYCTYVTVPRDTALQLACRCSSHDVLDTEAGAQPPDAVDESQEVAPAADDSTDGIYGVLSFSCVVVDVAGRGAVT